MRAQSVQGSKMERSSQQTASKWDELATDWCPVARALSVIGDRWTILIVRDCFLGKSRFEEFQKSLGVTRHVLSDRLKRLVELGVLERNAYSQRPLRYAYSLSDKGRDFAPALVGLKDWGKKHMPIRKPAAV
jgi:DNA-binding HxlR family transcriptional regulator